MKTIRINRALWITLIAGTITVLGAFVLLFAVGP
jgi:hypothetical protein